MKTRRHRCRGASLIEALVALTLLGLTLLMSLAVLWHGELVERRVRAHRDAWRTLVAVHEELRAGRTLTPGTTSLDIGALSQAVTGGKTLPEGLKLWAEVEDRLPRGLQQVTLRARYAVGGESFDRTLETLVWRAPTP